MYNIETWPFMILFSFKLFKELYINDSNSFDWVIFVFNCNNSLSSFILSSMIHVIEIIIMFT